MRINNSAWSNKARRRQGAIIAAGCLVAAAIVPAVRPEAARGNVPTPQGNESVISVRIGGWRDPSTNLVNAAPPGAQLQLYEGSSATTAGAAITEPWATCTSDADGDCSFVVPDTGPGGDNRDARFWIGQTAAPSGYYTDPTVVTSADAQGNTFQDSAYQSRTGPQLRAGGIYRSTSDFMASASGVRISSGIWLESMVNPPFPASCGMNAALVMDLSGSVADSGAEATLKSAATSLVDALTGTPSQVALFTFGSRAPAKQANNVNRPLTPISTQGGADTVKAWINGISVPAPHEATNWDRGLMQVAQSPDQFDLVVVITDGNPTRYGVDGLGTGILTRFIEIENSVFSANAVKQLKNARIIAVGVGDGATSVPGDNFAAISGPVTKDADPLRNDYYQEDWDEAAAVLKTVAATQCKGSLTVVKQIVPTDNATGDVAGALPADGWEFSVGGTGLTPGRTTLTTAVGTGAASTDFTLDDLSLPGDLLVSETVAADYQLHQTEIESVLKNADCFLLGGVSPVRLDVTNVGANGFSVQVGQQDSVSCTVYNQHESAHPASIRVSKKWVLRQVDLDGDPVLGTVDQLFDQGSQPGPFQAGLLATLDKGQPTESELPDLTWGTEYSGMTEGVTADLSEAPAAQIPYGCEVVSADVTGGPDGSGGLTPVTPKSLDQYQYTLQAGLNQFQITNTIACRSVLTLYKVVDDQMPPVADSDLWELEGIPLPDDTSLVTPLVGPKGRFDATDIFSAPTANVTPGRTYAMAESGGDPEYQQWRSADPAEPLLAEASGSWVCNLETADFSADAWISDGLRGAVAVPWGGHVRCVAANYTAQITVTKTVVGGSASSSDSAFTVTPVGLGADSLPTHAGLESGATTHVKPGQVYTVTEDSGGPAFYVLDSVECTWDQADGTERTEVFSAPPQLTLALGGNAECEFTNRGVANVLITKTDSRAPDKVPSAGSQFAYFLEVESNGAVAAQSVDVSDAVPTGLRIVSVTPAGTGWADFTSGNSLRLTNASLPVGSYRITVVVAVTNALDTTKNLVNRACVKAANNSVSGERCSTDIIPGGPPPTTRSPRIGPTPPGTSPSGALPFSGAGGTGWLIGAAVAGLVGGTVLLAARRRTHSG
ncbi:MAG: DUF11 domain-containing protein [Bifidobacteriaceae bacterium]|jgi:uncharacterized repeat protein (TIGR01451 family)|nr:DUF11 domain-containing protein [Bifidobacteriaceae bacterium]